MRRLAHLERTDDAQFVSGLGNNKLRVIDHCECTLAPLLEFWDALVLEEILGQKKRWRDHVERKWVICRCAFLTNRIKQVFGQPHFYLFTPQCGRNYNVRQLYNVQFMNSGSPWSWSGRSYQGAFTGRVLFKLEIQSSYLACMFS